MENGMPLAVQQKIERLVLVLFSIYYAGFFAMSFFGSYFRWWVPIIVVINWVLSGILFFVRYRDYRFRVTITTILIHVTVCVYITVAEDLYQMLPFIGALGVIAGLYGVQQLAYVQALSVLFSFFYYAVIRQEIMWDGMKSLAIGLLYLGNMLAEAGAIYLWLRKRNESLLQLQNTIEKLKEAERSKDEFFANVSHEIRTPINTICGMSDAICFEENLNKVRDEVSHIQAAGKSLMSIVSDMLDFTEIQSGKISLEEEAYHITSSIDDIVRISQRKADGKNIELQVEYGEDIPCSLLGDEKKIRRVLLNLVDNAIKFTETGCVRIIVSQKRTEQGIDLSITVKDTGIGMDQESQKKLFSSFPQADTGSNRQRGGIGLGFAISKEIVQKMGGKITVESEIGKGTNVQFVVPQKVLDDTHVDGMAEKIADEVRNEKKMIAPKVHVLVVDDNEVNLEVMQYFLEKYQIKVSKAESGKSALEKVETEEYDLIFMDHMMPEMDGIETLHHIREKEGAYYKKVPVIIQTANAVAGAKEMFLSEGFTDFLEKPMENSALERVLKRNLPAEKMEFIEEKKENANITVKPKSSERKEKEEFAIGDLDVQAGILYCNGKDGYLAILEVLSETAEEKKEYLEEMFEQEQWKEYTIAVHGMKSSMKTIGAVKLSELSLRLEQAGKKEDIDYIRKEHGNLLQEFERVITMIRESGFVEKKEVEMYDSEQEELPVLTEQMFEQKRKEFEEAVYELESEKMLAILKELQEYQCDGVSMKKKLAPIVCKVEMSDYMSALESLARLKEK